MRTAKDLINSPEGIDFLISNGISLNPEEFVAQLEPPVNPSLSNFLGYGTTEKPVYAFQQVYIDVTLSMLDRITVLDELRQFEAVSPIFLWIDTDRAGSDKVTTRIYWPHWGRRQSIPICPLATKDIESRFVELDRAQLETAIDKLGMYLVQSVNGSRSRAIATEKYERLSAIFLDNATDSLSEFNHRVSYFLLNEYAGLDPASVLVSEIIENELLTNEINLVLNQIDDVIRVFNQAIDALAQKGIYPVIKPLAECYLPLNYSCPSCQRRIRMQRENRVDDQYAVAYCRCGERYDFYLGNGILSTDELIQTGRWSPDVCLALLINDLVSGFVAGRSSGIYFGILMKEVLEKVLGKRRIPVLFPESLGLEPPVQFDSLIYRYLAEQDTVPAREYAT